MSLYMQLFLASVAVNLLASMRFSVVSWWNSRKAIGKAVTGAEVAEQFLWKKGLSSVAMKCRKGKHTDCYCPRSKVLFLSKRTWERSSVTAVSVAAHEVGHAIQHKNKHPLLLVRRIFVPVTNVGQKCAVPAVIAGSLLGEERLWLIGVGCFFCIAVLRLLTLPLELDASRRALEFLSEYLNEKELRRAKKVLRAAAFTYMASFLGGICASFQFWIWAQNMSLFF